MIFPLPYRQSWMRTAGSLAPQKSRGTLPSASKAKRISQCLCARRSIRTKNILATVQAVINLTEAETVADFKNAIEGRLHALANVHALFVESRWSGAELHDIVAKELAPYRKGDGTRVTIEGPALKLKSGAAQTIAVIFHELTTNAVKYGALSTWKGRIGVSWTRPEIGQLVVRWAETGGPAVTPPTRKGFGTRVMANTIHHERGEIRFDWNSAGLACEITLPI